MLLGYVTHHRAAGNADHRSFGQLALPPILFIPIGYLTRNPPSGLQPEFVKKN